MLISIIIPTHNRSRYAIPTIRSACSLSTQIEIIVSDTSKQDDLTEIFIKEITDGQLKILRPGRPLSVVDNFNYALSFSKGKYIIFIGDDDLVHESVIEIATWALENNIEAIQCTLPASYYWPDFHSRYYGLQYASRLAIKKFSALPRKIETRSSYVAAMSDFGGGVGTMPRAYLGMISSDLVDKVTRKYGNLFGGVSPDIYSAALIANCAENVIEIDYPFIVPGSSGASTSGQSASGGHKGDLRDNDHIRPFRDLVWDARIPEFYCVPSVWAFSLLMASKKVDNGVPNFMALYIKCLFRHPSYWLQILKALRAYSIELNWISLIVQVVASISAEIKSQAIRVARKLRDPRATGGTEIVISDIRTSFSAKLELSAYLQDRVLKLD